MRVLVTGANGFVGRHLLHELTSNGHQPIGAILPGTFCATLSTEFEGVDFIDYEATNRQEVIRQLVLHKPDAIIHLAGISHVIDASKDVSRLADINVHSVQCLCDGINAYAKDPIPLVFASTALVYGLAQGAVNEASPIAPVGAYAKSKVAAEYMLSMYSGTLVKPYIVRPFNHTGPGQSPDFVCPGLARKIASSTDGVIKVGNLTALRDLSDVRDIVRAYRFMVEKRPDVMSFVLGTGKLVKISDVLSMLIKISEKRITPITDEALLRPADTAAIFADYRQATQHLGWKPTYELAETLNDLYRNYRV